MSKYKSSKDHFQELLEFRQEHQRAPSYNAHDQEEKCLYSWVQSMKMSRRGKGTASYPDWLEKEAKKHGILDWFLVLDKAKEQFLSLIDFYLEHKQTRRSWKIKRLARLEMKLLELVFWWNLTFNKFIKSS